jgi:hypothetical protein
MSKKEDKYGESNVGDVRFSDGEWRDIVDGGFLIKKIEAGHIRYKLTDKGVIVTNLSRGFSAREHVATELDMLAAVPQTPSGSPTGLMPPRAEWLLAWCMRKEQRDDVLGDLEEMFLNDKLPVLGSRAALVWYWWQIGKSIWPFIKAFVVRGLAGVAVTAVLRRLGL